MCPGDSHRKSSAEHAPVTERFSPIVFTPPPPTPERGRDAEVDEEALEDEEAEDDATEVPPPTETEEGMEDDDDALPPTEAATEARAVSGGTTPRARRPVRTWVGV